VKRQPKKGSPVTVTAKPSPKRVTITPVARIGGVAAAVTTKQTNATRRALVISGFVLSALIFLLVVTVPATETRFPAAGRLLLDHQLDLVLTGIATLLLTAMLFYVTQ